MAHRKARGFGLGLLAGVCALTAAPAWADDDGYTALILGHAFLSQPDATYMQEVIDTYISPQYTVVGDPVSVYTPETDYGTGLTQGIADLDAQLQPLLQNNADPNLVVAGYSMSTSVITQEMINLANTEGGAPDVDGLKFILAEDLQAPDGGYFTRFPAMFAATLPATPSDTPYDTTLYSIQYSGASDFPQYYGNTWADLNAANGYVDLHPYLLPNWPAYFDPSTVADAVKEHVSDGYTGSTDYYLIPTQDLPLLDGLRLMPGAPSSYADLVQPDMRVLVDLGYNYAGPADVTTAATLTNPDIDMTAVNDYLLAGANQGMLVSLVDMGLLPQSDLASIADLYPYVPDVQGLVDGALSNNALAATDASMSSAALADALAGSSNPLIVDFGQYIPGMVTNLADFYQMLAGTLG